VDERDHRLARNEAAFREVNERIQSAAAAHAIDDHLFEFLCECSNVDCTLLLPLTLAAYERVRSDSAQFVVAPGHELPEVEEVVFRGEGYQVVRKFGAAAELAEESDPRT
jgi:hypothetical protein